MRYAVLIYRDESINAQFDREQTDALMRRYDEFGIRYQDHIRASGPLQGIASATSVQVRGGRTLTTDGPFAETKEQLGGLLVLECDDLNQATEIASHIPDAVRGSIEVRPVMTFA